MANLTMGIRKMRAGRFYATSLLAYKPHFTFILLCSCKADPPFSSCYHLHRLKSLCTVFFGLLPFQWWDGYFIHLLYFINFPNVPYIPCRPCLFAKQFLWVETRAYFSPWWLPLTALLFLMLTELSLQLYMHSGKLLYWPWESTLEGLCWSYFAEVVLRTSDKLPRDNISPYWTCFEHEEWEAYYNILLNSFFFFSLN